MYENVRKYIIFADILHPHVFICSRPLRIFSLILIQSKYSRKILNFRIWKLYNYKTNLRTSKGHSATKPITHPHKEEPSSTTRPRYPRGRSPWESPSNLFVVASVGYLRDSGLCMQRGPRAILHWLPRALTNAQCKCTCAVWLKGFVLISGGVFEWGFRV